MQITFKLMGKRRSAVTSAFDFPKGPTTFQAFLEALVRHEVAQYNTQQAEQPPFRFLLPDDIQLAVKTGKVGFGSIYNDNQANPEQAVAMAITAFIDGLYAVFFGEQQVTDLDKIIDIQPETSVTFIRLTLLTGGY